MIRLVIVALLFASFASAQTKKPAQKNDKSKMPKDTLKVDSLAMKKDEKEPAIPRQFMVYTKKQKQKTDRMKLCFNLVSPDTVLNYCMNDSVCRFPEKSKILFQNKQGDTTYVLIYVEAFSKPADRPECDAGKEVKLVYARWNTKTNKAVWRQKNIESCMRTITNMTKDPIMDWDGSTVLTVSYHRGSDFLELKFDPQQYLLGLQTPKDGEQKSDN